MLSTKTHTLTQQILLCMLLSTATACTSAKDTPPQATDPVSAGATSDPFADSLNQTMAETTTAAKTIQKTTDYPKYDQTLIDALQQKSDPTAPLTVELTAQSEQAAALVDFLRTQQITVQQQVDEVIFANIKPTQLKSAALMQHPALQSARLAPTMQVPDQPVVAPQPAAPVALAPAEQAIEMLQVLAKKQAKQNVVFSPYSIAETGAALLLGSEHPDQLKRPKWFLSVLDDPNLRPTLSVLRPNNSYQSWNTLWYQQGATVQPDYEQDYKRVLSGSTTAVDFAQAATTAERINHTINEQTAHKIPKLLSEGDLKGAQAVLTNAAYFKSGWSIPFPAYKTTPQPFTNLDGQVVKVAMMTHKFPVEWAEHEGWTLVNLPFKDGTTKLTLLVPPAKKPKQMISYALLAQLDQHKTLKPVTLKLPKVDLQGSSLNLETLLPKLSSWSLDRVLTSQPLRQLKGIHQASIEWDETGAEAAAATAVTAKRSIGVDNDPVVTVDRPFVFLVRDQKQVLFAGAVRQLPALLITPKADDKATTPPQPIAEPKPTPVVSPQPAEMKVAPIEPAPVAALPTTVEAAEAQLNKDIKPLLNQAAPAKP